MPRIQFTTTDGTTGDIELTQEHVRIGRADDNDIVVPDGSVSSHHAEASFDGASWILTDTGSTNGTKVGGARVDAVQLVAGGAFSLGSVECVFIGDEGEATAAAASYASSASATAASYSASGYGAQPCDRSRRTGFGPKVKEKNPGAAPLMALGVLALLACIAAAVLFTKMGA